MQDNILFTDINCEDIPVYNPSSVLEKCYQLKHDKEALKDENMKLHSQLESAEETIKDCSARLTLLTQQLNSLSETAAERDSLLDLLEKTKTSNFSLKMLYEEQKSHSHQLEIQTKNTNNENKKLLIKLKNFEKQTQEKEEQFKELIQIVHDYEELLEQKQAQIAEKDNEINLINAEFTELHSKLVYFEENSKSDITQTSNSNVTDLSKEVCSAFEEKSSKKLIIQVPHAHIPTMRKSWHQSPLVRIQSPATSVRQKSLAEELSEVDEDEIRTNNVPQIENSNTDIGVQVNEVYDEKDANNHEQLSLLRMLEKFKSKLSTLNETKHPTLKPLNKLSAVKENLNNERNLLKRHSNSTESLDRFRNNCLETSELIIKKCQEILSVTGCFQNIFLAARTKFIEQKNKFSDQRFYEKSNAWETSSPFYAFSLPNIYIPDHYSNNKNMKSRKSSKGIQTNFEEEKIDANNKNKLPLKLQIEKYIKELIEDYEYKSKFEDNSKNFIPNSFEELTKLFQSDQNKLTYGISLNKMTNKALELSIANEVLELQQVTKILQKKIEEFISLNLAKSSQTNYFDLKTSDKQILDDKIMHYVIILNRLVFLVHLLLEHSDRNKLLVNYDLYITKILQFLETQIHVSTDHLKEKLVKIQTNSKSIVDLRKSRFKCSPYFDVTDYIKHERNNCQVDSNDETMDNIIHTENCLPSTLKVKSYIMSMCKRTLFQIRSFKIIKKLKNKTNHPIILHYVLPTMCCCKETFFSFLRRIEEIHQTYLPDRWTYITFTLIFIIASTIYSHNQKKNSILYSRSGDSLELGSVSVRNDIGKLFRTLKNWLQFKVFDMTLKLEHPYEQPPV